MSLMLDEIGKPESINEKELIRSYNKEREINNMRNSLRTANPENINSKRYSYQAGIYYMDIISDLERTGDYIINVVDTLREQFRRHIA
ncbi:MAG: Na/Pi cotransporter family protein, partial [Muribaculaceae bacterium]|nr:Na/Pi cotransporter family protein [Muribaculaceae bacterium]